MRTSANKTVTTNQNGGSSLQDQQLHICSTKPSNCKQPERPVPCPYEHTLPYLGQFNPNHTLLPVSLIYSPSLKIATDRCFALPQLLYRWRHQSGIFLIPPRIHCSLLPCVVSSSALNAYSEKYKLLNP
jgi:hypothetical protein